MPTYWINGKKYVSDKDLNPDELESLAGPQLRPPAPPKNIFQRGYDALTTPLTTAPQQFAQKLAGMIPESTDVGFQAANEMIPGLGTGLSMIAGGTKGMLEGLGPDDKSLGLGNVASQLTSPADLVATASGLGALRAGRLGLQAAKPLATASRIASAPAALHGGINLIHGESTPEERLWGAVEAAGGIAGLAQPTPTIQPRRRNIPPPDFAMADMGAAPPPVPPSRMLPAPPPAQLPPMQRTALPDAVMNADIVPPDFPVGDLPLQQSPEPIIDAQIVSEAPGLGGTNWPMEVASSEFMPPAMPQRRPNIPPPPINLEGVPGGQLGGQVFDQSMPPGMLEQPLRPDIDRPYQSGDLIDAQVQVPELNQVDINEILNRQPRTLDDIRNPISQRNLDLGRQIEEKGLPDIEPSGMAVDAEGKISLDLGRKEDVLPLIAKTYAGHTVTVAGKELIQNALDAVRDLGGKGKLHVEIDPSNSTLVVEDSGAGLTKDELATVYTNLSESGKRDKGGYIGEMGFGKMAYMATGESITITTVAKNPKTGQLEQYVLKGTPKELMAGGVVPEQMAVQPNQPTGTRITYKPKQGESFYNLKQYVENLKKYSNVHTPIDVSITDFTGQAIKSKIPSGTLNAKEVIASGENEGTKYAIAIPENAQALPQGATQIALILVNRGMFQGVDSMDVPFGIKNVPDRLVINLDPKVNALDDNYPLTVPTRERLIWKAKADITKQIKEKIIDARAQERTNEIQRIYDNTPESALGNFIAYDTGGKFTPEEMQMVLDSPVLSSIADEMQKMVNILSDMFSGEMIGKVEKIGFVFDDKLRGVNILNPSTPDKMAIMINPGIFFGKGSVEQTANGIVHTTLHEFAHTMAREEGANFTAKLGDVYERFGLEQQQPFLIKVKQAIRVVKNGRERHSPEVQKILSRYNESRGRTATTSDLLIREGVSRATEPIGQERVSPSRATDGEGTAWRDLTPIEKTSEIWNLPRGMMSVDIPFATSAGLRQGLPWVASRHWWRAWEKQAKAYGSEQAYRNQITQWETKPLYRPQVRFRGQGNAPIFEPSIAEQMGLATSDLTDMSRREEVLKSQLAEKIPGYGKLIRASNRAYTAFLNHIRYSAFEQLMTKMGAFDGRRVTNVPLAKEIADFVNTTTGRGTSKFSAGISKDKSVTINVEQVMGPAAQGFFSPRLWKSRLDMLNPSTFMMADKRMRMQWIKAYLSVAGAWWGMASLAEMMLGAEVNKDPRSSDYGKIRVGDTRFDAGGGFQQNLVIANRVMNPIEQGDIPIPETGLTPLDLATGPLRFGGGGITSPVSGRFQPYGERLPGGNPNIETPMSDMLRFTANKLHPSAKYIYDYFNRSKQQPFYLGDRTAQLFIPMFAGDLAETILTDPILAGFSLAASSTGMGAQTFEGGPGKPVFTPLTGLDYYDPKFTGR